jgi:acyl carrier protein
MDRDKIKGTVIQIASELFSIDKNRVDEDLKAGSIDTWDSLGHLNLFLAVENELKVKFSTDEILNTVSIRKLIDKLTKKLSE